MGWKSRFAALAGDLGSVGAETAPAPMTSQPIEAEGPAIGTATEPAVLAMLPEARRITGPFNRAARGSSQRGAVSGRFRATGRRGITSTRFNRAARGQSERGLTSGDVLQILRSPGSNSPVRGAPSRLSYSSVGDRASVDINQVTGRVAAVWRTSRLMRDFNQVR